MSSGHCPVNIVNNIEHLCPFVSICVHLNVNFTESSQIEPLIELYPLN